MRRTFLEYVNSLILKVNGKLGVDTPDPPAPMYGPPEML